MSTPIAEAMARPLFVLVLAFAVVLVVVGVHWPGGGFVAGIIAALAFALRAFTLGTDDAHEALRVEPVVLEAAGLALIVASALAAWVTGRPFLSVARPHAPGPATFTAFLGTDFLFQLGVFVHVAGVALVILFHVMEREAL